MTAEVTIRTHIRGIYNDLKKCQDRNTFVELLKCLCQCLPGPRKRTQSCQFGDIVTEETVRFFLRNHYAQTANLLLDITSIENVGSLSRSEFTENFQAFFTEGSCEDAFLVLTSAVGRLRYHTIFGY